MCRAKSEGGRRCPFHANQHVMAVANAKTMLNRWMNRLDQMDAQGAPAHELARAEGYLRAAMDRLATREQVAIPDAAQAAENSDALPPAHPSAADSITAESVASMSWDEVGELYTRHGDDPEAIEKLQLLVEEREAAEADADPWGAGEPDVGAGDWGSNPTLRPERRLTPHERAREEYDYYVSSQYLKCVSELSFLVNKE